MEGSSTPFPKPPFPPTASSRALRSARASGPLHLPDPAGRHGELVFEGVISSLPPWIRSSASRYLWRQLRLLADLRGRAPAPCAARARELPLEPSVHARAERRGARQPRLPRSAPPPRLHPSEQGAAPGGLPQPRRRGAGRRLRGPARPHPAGERCRSGLHLRRVRRQRPQDLRLLLHPRRLGAMLAGLGAGPGGGGGAAQQDRRGRRADDPQSEGLRSGGRLRPLPGGRGAPPRPASRPGARTRPARASRRRSSTSRRCATSSAAACTVWT